MAISRSNIPSKQYRSFGQSAYSFSGGQVSQFISSGANPNDTLGATYRVHRFTSPGLQRIKFVKPGYVDLLIVGAGGIGGNGANTNGGGGGGGGGVIELYDYFVNPSTYEVYVAQRNNAAGVNGVYFALDDKNGENSRFGDLIAVGGGQGGMGGRNTHVGGNGGSGGGANGNSVSVPGSGTLNQGNDGGAWGSGNAGSGGGGAGGAGQIATSSVRGGDGGQGIFLAFDSNVPAYYSAGGGGSGIAAVGSGGVGGSGFGGNGWNGSGNGPVGNYDGRSWGCGGGGSYTTSTTTSVPGGSGFQGIVIVRYRVQ